MDDSARFGRYDYHFEDSFLVKSHFLEMKAERVLWVQGSSRTRSQTVKVTFFKLKALMLRIYIGFAIIISQPIYTPNVTFRKFSLTYY